MGKFINYRLIIGFMELVYDTTIVGKRYAHPEKELVIKRLGNVHYDRPLKIGERIGITMHGRSGDAVYNLLVDYIEPSKNKNSAPKVRLRCMDLLSHHEELGSMTGELINQSLG
ncbi:hypothetical protein HYS31_00335 [Candidatus Woesearchaeota archaeon]|nr:hypothetical protein [Candidatus Woesearchaeota archaeon]